MSLNKGRHRIRPRFRSNPLLHPRGYCRSCRAQIQGTGTFDANGILKEIDEIDQITIRRLGDQVYDAKARPIWDIIEEVGKCISEKEWEQFPKDASINLDRYLYGKEKKDV